MQQNGAMLNSENATSIFQGINENVSQELGQQTDVPQQKLRKYEEKIIYGQKLNFELNESLRELQSTADRIKQRMEGLLWKKESDDGYLTHRVEEYGQCFSVDVDKFNQLLNEDIQHWKERLEGVIKEETERIRQTEEALKKQKQAIQAVVKRQCFVLSGKYFRLSKLPQLPDVSCDGKINFSWPTDDLIRSMLKDQEIKMQRLDIWLHNGAYLCSVQVTLTNGDKSPIFRADLGYHQNQQSLSMSQDVCKLGLKCDRTTIFGGLKFSDKNNNESKWERSNYSWKEQQIPEGESIIGVYGYLAPDNYYIFNFGFITVSYN